MCLCLILMLLLEATKALPYCAKAGSSDHTFFTNGTLECDWTVKATSSPPVSLSLYAACVRVGSLGATSVAIVKCSAYKRPKKGKRRVAREQEKKPKQIKKVNNKNNKQSSDISDLHSNVAHTPTTTDRLCDIRNVTAVLPPALLLCAVTRGLANWP